MKVTFQGNPLTLEGTQAKVGSIVKFVSTNLDLSDLDITKVEGKKVINFFPSIDTGVCDAQTKQAIEMAKANPEVKFITISMDLPFALGRWCQANAADNIIATSDYKTHSFGKAAGLVIKELQLLARGFMVLDESNKVIEMQICDEVTDQVDFDKVKAAIA